MFAIRRSGTLGCPLVKVLRFLLVTTLLIGMAVALRPSRPVYATAALVVTTTVDELVSPGTGCSLREAITNANNDTDTYPECRDSGTYGNDGIVLPAGTYVLNIGSTNEDANADGDLDILNAGDLFFESTGAIIDGNNAERVFDICPTTQCDIHVVLTGVTIQNGNAKTDDGYGGGIHIYNSYVTLNASTVTSNTADMGGGIYNNFGTLEVENSSIASNEADRGGGIFNYDDSTTTIDASTISDNIATASGGGIENWGTLNVQNGSVIGGIGTPNTTNNGDGGGIYNGSNTTTVNDSTISANTAGNGGGIYNSGGTTIVDASSISANVANYNGGGIFNSAAVTLTVQNGSTIGGIGTPNTATNDGGGLYNSGAMKLDGITISYNTAGRSGGIYNDGDTYMVLSTLSYNTSTIEDGGAIFNQAGTIDARSCRILYNTANRTGGGVYNNVDTLNAVSVQSSCIVGNSDVSFYNNSVSSQQTATGNWWGVATGPDTLYADTTSGSNVDTTSYLSVPIMGCPNSYPEQVYLPLVLSQ